MKIHSLATFTSSDKIDVFHYRMFHGREFGEIEPHVFGGDLSSPLRLVRNVWRIPDVFQPVIKLVVSHVVREKIEHFPNIEFAKVEFAKTFSYPYLAGDFSFYDSPEYKANPDISSPKTFFNRFPDAERRPFAGARYHELVAPRLQDIKGRYKGSTLVTCQPTQDLGEVQLELSRRLIDEHPIFWHMCMFFNSLSFGVIADHIDWDYFETTTIEF